MNLAAVAGVAAGFDRQDAQGVAGFPFGREDAFADIDVGAGAVVFGDIGIDFNKRTVAGFRSGIRPSNLLQPASNTRAAAQKSGLRIFSWRCGVRLRRIRS